MDAESTASENVLDVRSLISPAELRRRLPATESAARVVRETRLAFRAAIHAIDPYRLVVIVGPCSIHDPAAAIEYALRLRAVAELTRDHLLLVMRTYLEKPRTTVGWKGLVNDPTLDGSCDLAAGLEIGRRTLASINEIGVPCGGELLDPVISQYLGDLFSWSAIGARTSQSQTHREIASGLAMPVGFKNGVDGDLAGAVNGVHSAGRPHTFVGIGADGFPTVVRTRGNPDRHVVLRGGASGPNHSPRDVAGAAALLAGESIARPILVDCSHGNSGKDHRLQPTVCGAVLEQVRDGDRRILGFALESNLFSGRQTWQPGEDLRYGVSITDACIGWEETENLLLEAADVVARTKKKPGP